MYTLERSNPNSPVCVIPWRCWIGVLESMSLLGELNHINWFGNIEHFEWRIIYNRFNNYIKFESIASEMQNNCNKGYITWGTILLPKNTKYITSERLYLLSHPFHWPGSFSSLKLKLINSFYILSIPFFKETWFAPNATTYNPDLTISLARTIVVVVPLPAKSIILVATYK